MPGSRDPVKDHTHHVALAVKESVAECHRSDAPGHSRSVNDQDYRQTEQLRHLRRAALIGGAAPAIVESHHSLYDGDVLSAQVVSKGLAVCIFLPRARAGGVEGGDGK